MSYKDKIIISRTKQYSVFNDFAFNAKLISNIVENKYSPPKNQKFQIKTKHYVSIQKQVDGQRYSTEMDNYLNGNISHYQTPKRLKQRIANKSTECTKTLIPIPIRTLRTSLNMLDNKTTPQEPFLITHYFLSKPLTKRLK